MHDRFKVVVENVLGKQQSSPKAISHKELTSFLTKARKEKSSKINSENNELNENHEFDELLADWTNASKKLLIMLNQKDVASLKNRKPKSLLAFGAMGAHINMALQALKATEFD